MPKRGRGDDDDDDASPRRDRKRGHGDGDDVSPRRDQMRGHGDDGAATSRRRASKRGEGRGAGSPPERAPKRGRSDDGASPPRARRRGSSSGSGGTRNWAGLPPDLLELIFVRLQGSAGPASHVCHQWRLATLRFPRPVVLTATCGRMELLVPTTLMPGGAHLSQSTKHDSPPFRCIVLPAPRVKRELRFIGGSPSVPLFIDHSLRKVVIQRLVCPLGGSPNAAPQILFDAPLPQGLEPEDVNFGIFALNNSDASTEPSPELSNIKGVIVITQSLIVGMLLSGYGVTAQWTMISVPPLPPKMTSDGVPAQMNKNYESLLPPKTQRIFLSASSIGDTTYLIDGYFNLSSCFFNMSGELHMDDILANRSELQDRTPRTLRTWLLHLPSGETSDQKSKLICLRVEHIRPRSYYFRAYEISLTGGGRTWRSCRDLRDHCIFIHWGSGCEAFAYWHPERVGLTRGHVYDSRQGLRSYQLNRAYQENIVPHSGYLTWPFSMWMHPRLRIPYVPPPCDGHVAEAVPPPYGGDVVAQKTPSQARLMPAEPPEQWEEGNENEGAEG